MDFRDLSFERISFLLYLCSNRRSPLGLRELKHHVLSPSNRNPSRSPLGLRELKRFNTMERKKISWSQPAWAA